MDTRMYLCKLRPLGAALLLLASLALGACNGTISSIGVPAASPWTNFETGFMSPLDDLTVVTTGSNITASLILPPGAIELCNSDQGKFLRFCSGGPGTCGLSNCQAQAPSGATNVTFVSQEFLYQLNMSLDRPAFSAGGVELVSTSAGTQGAIALTLDSGSGLSVGAGFTAGLIPVPSTSSSDPTNLALDDAGLLLMGPHWPDFGTGFVCADGTTTSCNPDATTDGVVAACNTSPDPTVPDGLAFRVDATPGPYTLTCGSVPVNLTINPTFASSGDCISGLIAQHCGNLLGQARASCNHSQQSVCRTLFHG
jgi:hypothetical protein